MTRTERKLLDKLKLDVERLEAIVQEMRGPAAARQAAADEEIRHCRQGLGLPVDVPIRRARA